MINDRVDYEIEVYTCRLCGCIESVSAEAGIRPMQCPECHIEGSFVLIDVLPSTDQMTIR